MIIDILCAVLLVLALFKGYSRGLVVAIFSIVSIIIGLAAALKLSAVVAAYLTKQGMENNQWLPVISFAAVFLAVLLLVRLGAQIIEKSLNLAMLGWANKLGGILLYLMLYALLLSVVLFYVVHLNLLGSETLAGSKTWPYLKPIGPWVMDGIGKWLPWLKNMFTDLKEFFGQISENIS